jgi:hypothetical protein
MQTLKSMPSHEEHLIRQERLVFNFSINGNATPASKTQAQDIPGLVILRMEGQTAAADAIEPDLGWTAPVDNNAGDSIFGILINLSQLGQGLNLADKVYSVSLTEVTAVSTSEVLSSPSAASNYLTPEGNIAVSVAATGLNLASEDVTFTMVIEYREAR